MDSAVELIGQKRLLNKINCYVQTGSFPRCSVLVGPAGSGKKTVAKYVAHALRAECVVSSGKIDDVRQIIQLAHKAHIKTVYVFTDAGNMSNNAQNALLKLLEEPPNNAYIMVTVQSTADVLLTIVSRCVMFSMDRYTPAQIDSYYSYLVNQYVQSDADIIRSVCETPGDVQIMLNSGVGALYAYARLVVDNIAEVSGANALKIGSRIAFKDTDADKFDLALFFKTFRMICAQNLNITAHAHWILITSNRLRELSIKGINKSMLFDTWVLQCRQAVIAQ